MPFSSLRLVAVLAAVLIGVTACASAAEDNADGELVAYERAWPTGIVESTTVYEDGRVTMLHGEHLERFQLEPEGIEMIRAALELPRAEGSDSDVPQRTITLPDETAERVGPPEPDSAVDLLDRLTDTHSLDAPAAGTDEHTAGASAEPSADHDHESMPSESPGHDEPAAHDDMPMESPGAA